jgi:hypothetical protein
MFDFDLLQLRLWALFFHVGIPPVKIEGMDFSAAVGEGFRPEGSRA